VLNHLICIGTLNGETLTFAPEKQNEMAKLKYETINEMRWIPITVWNGGDLYCLKMWNTLMTSYIKLNQNWHAWNGVDDINETQHADKVSSYQLPTVHIHGSCTAARLAKPDQHSACHLRKAVHRLKIATPPWPKECACVWLSFVLQMHATTTITSQLAHQ